MSLEASLMGTMVLKAELEPMNSSLAKFPLLLSMCVREEWSM